MKTGIMRILLSVGFASLLCATLRAVPAEESSVEIEKGQPRVELGLVKWQRNLDEAKALAKKADKPILLMFQEIPG